MGEKPDYRTFSEIHRAKLITAFAWMLFAIIAGGLSFYVYGYMQPSLVRVLASFAALVVIAVCSWEIYLINYVEYGGDFNKYKANTSLYPRRRPQEQRTIKRFLIWLSWESLFFGPSLFLFLMVEVLVLYFCIEEMF